MSRLNLEQSKEAIEKFISHAATGYDRFKSDRDTQEVDRDAQVADAMMRCWRNADIAELERAETTGQPDTEAPTASVGSVRFFRLVNQKNAQLDSALHSADIPYSFAPISNPEVFNSAQEGSDQAAIHNVLAKYTWKMDSVPEKLYEAGSTLFSKGYECFQVIWNSERKRVKLYDMERKKHTWKEVTVHSYPSLRQLGFENVYADLLGGPIEKQQLVIVQTLTTWDRIQQGRNLGWFDKDVVASMIENRDRYRWNGQEASEHMKEQSENEGKVAPNFSSTDLVLQWDVYGYVPIKGGEWDEANDYELHWMTLFGNSLAKDAASVVRLEVDFDPDGEIPLFMANVLPDNPNRLYHRTYAQAVRPLYSMECTLWAQTFDNNHGVNEPPIAFDSSQFNTTPSSMRFCRGQKWDIRSPRDSIVEFPPRSTLGENMALVDRLQREQETAFSSNINQMGEGFGGRMAATENLNISRSTSMPNVAELRYVMGKLIRWYARKVKSYWQGYAPEQLVKAIADEELTAPVYVDKIQGEEKYPEGVPIYGDFDVELNVLDEYFADFVEAQQELALLQTVATNAILQQSKTHRVDIGFWMRDFFRRRRIKNADRIVVPLGDSDAHLRQRDELRYMEETGQPVQVQPGEDHAAHISEIDAYILRLQPMLSVDADELNEQEQAAQSWADTLITQVIKPHRDQHQQALAQSEQAASSAGTPAAPGGGTPGQAAGGVPAASLGAALGG
jgi:hypothetical protein